MPSEVGDPSGPAAADPSRSESLGSSGRTRTCTLTRSPDCTGRRAEEDEAELPRLEPRILEVFKLTAAPPRLERSRRRKYPTSGGRGGGRRRDRERSATQIHHTRGVRPAGLRVCGSSEQSCGRPARPAPPRSGSPGRVCPEEDPVTSVPL